MNGCEYIQKLIDESHRPEFLSPQAAGHIESCAHCQKFAHERAALRKLLSSTGRVTVPANFNALLNHRLAAAKAAPKVRWLQPAIAFKLAAAASAVALLALFVAPRFIGSRDAKNERVAAPSINATAGPSAATTVAPLSDDAVTENTRVAARPLHSTMRPGVSRTPVSRIDEPFIGEDGGGVLLIRGKSGDIEVPVRTVSLGAQPLLISNGGQPVGGARSF